MMCDLAELEWSQFYNRTVLIVYIFQIKWPCSGQTDDHEAGVETILETVVSDDDSGADEDGGVAALPEDGGPGGRLDLLLLVHVQDQQWWHHISCKGGQDN